VAQAAMRELARSPLSHVWGRFWELPSLDREQRALLIRARDRIYRDLAALPKTAASYARQSTHALVQSACTLAENDLDGAPWSNA
jgi:hypothetical protein